MDVAQTVVQILSRVGNVDSKRLGSHSTSLAELALDSLAILEVIYELETQFDIEFEDEQLSTLKSVTDLVDAVTTQIHRAA